MRTMSNDIRHIEWEIALERASRPLPLMLSHLDDMDDSAVEDGIRMEIRDPSSVPPASEVMSPSAAEPSAHCSAPVTPSNKPASEVMATTATQTFSMPFRSNKREPRTRSLGCKNCEVLSAELKAVRELLSDEVVRNAELQQLRLPTSRETAARPKPFSQWNASPYVKLVEEFKEHTEGRFPLQKTRWNARRRANHVIYFLRFMSEPALPDLNLLFLKDYGRIRTFTEHLSDKNLKPATIRSYLLDAVAFVKYILMMAPEGVKIGGRSLNVLLAELRARVRHVSRSVLGRQLAQRHRMSGAGMVFHRRTLGLHLHRRIHRVLRQTLGICAFFQHEPAVPRLRELT
ncbi:uncharacterized protein LOC114551469 isoform X2 [Perca flavescens]|uniref:uncharacterized protein LOC114551469 isoform X2 n=1 Tax=Perca flavescens TaxID=8167 RepID=UPI00106EF279|nr:uncharacterized protein LOC114551469 isoform X2 [Perca flavescens]